MSIFCSQVGKMGVKSGGSEIGRQSQTVKVLRMRFSISRNVPRPTTYVLHTFPASHRPYSEKKQNQGGNTIYRVPPLPPTPPAIDDLTIGCIEAPLGGFPKLFLHACSPMLCQEAIFCSSRRWRLQEDIHGKSGLAAGICLPGDANVVVRAAVGPIGSLQSSILQSWQGCNPRILQSWQALGCLALGCRDFLASRDLLARWC